MCLCLWAYAYAYAQVRTKRQISGFVLPLMLPANADVFPAVTDSAETTDSRKYVCVRRLPLITAYAHVAGVLTCLCLCYAYACAYAFMR